MTKFEFLLFIAYVFSAILAVGLFDWMIQKYMPDTCGKDPYSPDMGGLLGLIWPISALPLILGCILYSLKAKNK